MDSKRRGVDSDAERFRVASRAGPEFGPYFGRSPARNRRRRQECRRHGYAALRTVPSSASSYAAPRPSSYVSRAPAGDVPRSCVCSGNEFERLKSCAQIWLVAHHIPVSARLQFRHGSAKRSAQSVGRTGVWDRPSRRSPEVTFPATRLAHGDARTSARGSALALALARAPSRGPRPALALNGRRLRSSPRAGRSSSLRRVWP